MEHYIENLRLKYERDINNLYRVIFRIKKIKWLIGLRNFEVRNGIIE